jgi:hypothetical protein
MAGVLIWNDIERVVHSASHSIFDDGTQEDLARRRILQSLHGGSSGRLSVAKQADPANLYQSPSFSGGLSLQRQGCEPVNWTFLNHLTIFTMREITSLPYVPTKQQLRARVTTVKAWQLPKQKSALAPDHVWTNEDMDPVKIENQTWTIWTWMAYWATDTINLGTWETASSILAVGLSWRFVFSLGLPRSPANHELKIAKLYRS